MIIKLFEEYSNINQRDSDGNKDGYCEKKYSNGNIFSKGYYINRIKQGYWEYYHNNGNISRRNNFFDGSISGYIQTYDINGRLEMEYIIGGPYDKELFLELEEKEYYKIMNIFNLDSKLLFSEYFYIFNNTNDFICKVSDDYYYICYQGVYTKYDQLNSLLIALKKLKNSK